MFLHILNDDEGRLFAEAAWLLIHVDDDVDEREELLLEELQVEMGIDLGHPDPRPSDEVLADMSSLHSSVVARVMLLELAGVALADLRIHKRERKFLEHVGRSIDVPSTDIDSFLDFSRRAQSVWREGRALVLQPSG